MTESVALGPGAEFDAIRSMLDRWGPRAWGIGDDAAVVTPPRGDHLLVSVDASIEGKHWVREWLTPREIGYRAVAAAMSDLAAMAARPVGILVALVLPVSWRPELAGIADGIGEAAELAHATILGGNVSDGGELSITTTVLGHAYEPLARSGALEGDHVYLTGRLGGTGAALRALQAGKAPSADDRVRFAHPVPRIEEARWLADRGASAGIDISDGLGGDLGHLAAASGVAIEIDLDAIPLATNVDLRAALASGEEYEIVVTSREPFDVAEFERRFAIPLTDIGSVRIASGGARVRSRDGGRIVELVRGHDHFMS
jgi:thiamine-monophosphate kinase